MNKAEFEYEQIYAAHYRQIYSFFYKLCRDREISEDMAKDTFYHAYRSLVRYSGRCEMLTWLTGIASELFVKSLKEEKFPALFIDLIVLDPEASISEAPGYTLSKKIDVSRARNILTTLPKKDCDVLLLHVFGEISFEDIARLLDISADSAKLIFTRAKESIKEELIND